MQLSSPSFQNNQNIPNKFSCQGENISPELNIKDVPKNAKSLVLILDDPDAPIGTFTHWTIWNIPPQTNKIIEAVDNTFATQGINSANQNGYIAPCPPTGTHHYIFSLYALSDNLNLPATTTVNDLKKAIQDKIITQTKLIGLYQKS